ncbi:MAG TPA: glycosyltransferase family 4 protein [Fimbriimonadaceae bacterium]|nr:glycosyltransferase family 4 protein [Fimbriimonadaceae bacterium]
MPAKVHLINPLWNAAGGSEWRTLSLFERLNERADVSLWSEQEPDPVLLGRYPIQRISPSRFPRGGNLVFVGVYYKIGGWVASSGFRRLIVVYNTETPELLQPCLEGFRRVVGAEPEIVFASRGLLARTPGVAGVVHSSPIDIERFSPAPKPARPFTIGRLSRDELDKHHPEDPEVYRALVAAGCRVRIMGGTVLASHLEGVQGVELLPPGAEAAEAFLRSLDLFFYRPHPNYYETWGRVVAEAMACGLPVVCGSSGGFVEFVEHRKSGLVVETTQEAIEAIAGLARDPGLATTLGRAGRQTVERMMGTELEQQLEFYLQ